jgi:hypothetical protein
MTSSGPKTPPVLQPASSNGSEDPLPGGTGYHPNKLQRDLWKLLAREPVNLDKPREVTAEQFDGAIEWVLAVKGTLITCEPLAHRPHCLFAGHWIAPPLQ